MPEFEEREDLVGSQCGPDCNAEVVAGVHRGVPVMWASHGTVSNALPDGASATAWIQERHRQYIVEKAAAEAEDREMREREEQRHGLTGGPNMDSLNEKLAELEAAETVEEAQVAACADDLSAIVEGGTASDDEIAAWRSRIDALRAKIAGTEAAAADAGEATNDGGGDIAEGSPPA